MIGILHHSPVTVSILLDRERFKPEFISESDVSAGLWEDKVADFIRSSRDNRIRVLFVERLSALQAMLADGLETDGIKVALYDDCDVLKAVPGVDLVDAGIEGSVWKTYQLLPERLNEALAATAPGVPEETLEFDPISAEEPLPPAVQPPPALPEGETDSVTQEMRQADAILKGALADESPQAPPEPVPEDDGDEELDEPQEEPEEAQEEPEEALEEPAESAPDPVPDPPPPPKPKAKAKKTKKKGKKRKKKLTSRKLF